MLEIQNNPRSILKKPRNNHTLMKSTDMHNHTPMKGPHTLMKSTHINKHTPEKGTNNINSPVKKHVRFKNINKKQNLKTTEKNKKQNKINILYSNPRGIMGKMTSLTSVAQATESHIIGLAETKLTKNLTEDGGIHLDPQLKKISEPMEVGE